MPDEPITTPKTVPQIQADLHELAQLLRQARHIQGETQQTLADLLDELRGELNPTAAVNSPHAVHLAEHVAQLARALHESRDAGVVAGARERLEQAIGRAEAQAPVVVGVVRRFIDALASIGI